MTVEYENGKFKRIDTIVVSAQHIKDVKYDQLKQVIKKLIYLSSTIKRLNNYEKPLILSKILNLSTEK